MRKGVNIFLVLRTGGDFRMRDVYLLAKHLHKQANGLAITIYCLTDIVNQKITLSNLTLLPLKNNWKGWWSKMNLFSPELDSYRPFLYLDLDTVVLNELRTILPDTEKEKDFIMLRDFYKSHKAASGLMWFPEISNKVNNIWEQWIAKGNTSNFRGDQDFINIIENPDYYWQDFTDKITTFKPKEWLRKLQGKETIVCFHGKPRIHEAAKSVEWVNKYVNE